MDEHVTSGKDIVQWLKYYRVAFSKWKAQLPTETHWNLNSTNDSINFTPRLDSHLSIYLPFSIKMRKHFLTYKYVAIKLIALIYLHKF